MNPSAEQIEYQKNSLILNILELLNVKYGGKKIALGMIALGILFVLGGLVLQIL